MIVRRFCLVAIILGVGGSQVGCASPDANETSVSVSIVKPRSFVEFTPDQCPAFDDDGNPIGDWGTYDTYSFDEAHSDGSLLEADMSGQLEGSNGTEPQNLQYAPGGPGKTLQELIDWCLKNRKKVTPDSPRPKPKTPETDPPKPPQGPEGNPPAAVAT
jgi:hypothetical protein